ncbi:MAG: CHAT domain-containing protein [Leptolyngbyaceae cyanobacterium MO_188.B28]|nr:CHAT domain-containing protein [Leptolyngbyaceae cyanobacterium MO_188.B28]
MSIKDEWDMDEQRKQLYMTLIEQLMWCASGEEETILQQQTQLVDAGLLEVMESEIEQLECRRKAKAAQRLQQIQQLAADLAAQNQSTSQVELVRETTAVGPRANSEQFLLEILQRVVESQGNAQQFYPWLEQHQERLNEALLQTLPQFSVKLLSGNAEQQRAFAGVLFDFGNLINQFPLGQRWINLELAITAYQQVLTVTTQTAMPVEWAGTMNNLATAYKDRIRGDRGENIEQAIKACQQALTVMTQTAIPVEWAATMNTLANAYVESIRGDRGENIEQAIKAYKECLTVRTQAVMPVEWAGTMNNLATAYKDRIQGDRGENIEQAISNYQQTLTVRTQTAMPVDWAQTMMNLATAYKNRIRGDRGENIEQAISNYQLALTVMTQTAMPVQWAQTMMNLALTYSERIRGDRNENIEQAISNYQSSLEFFKPELFPNNCRRAARSLGNLYFDQQCWQESVPIYQKALQAAETLYQSSILLEGKANELAETADLPRRAAYALARCGDLQAAVLTLEQGRARGLSETLDRDRADLSQLQQTHPHLYDQYQDVTNQLRNLETQQRLRMTSADRHEITPEVLRNQSQQLRQALTAILDQIRQFPGYEGFLSQPSFDDIRQALRPDNPLIYLVPTPNGSLALILTLDRITELWLDSLTDNKLIDLLNNNWIKAYNQSQTNHQTGLDTIDAVTHQLWQLLMAPLIAHLQEHNFHQATLIPTGYLSLLPLHAAWTKDSIGPTVRRYALDEIHFTYAPNARSLGGGQTIEQQTKANSILVIDNPRKDLPNSSREVTAAISTFAHPNILQHEQATIEGVLNALPHCNILHLSCHGTANLREPLTSGLSMSDGLLTLRDLLNLKLAGEGKDGIRLAILSACETGLAGTELADEAISLPTGLLQAGVAGVIASLWSVADLSTMVLLSRFYTLWRTHQMEPSQALTTAQKWLRDSEPSDIIAHCETFIPELASKKGDLYRALRQDFSHPYHWAAFSYTGV